MSAMRSLRISELNCRAENRITDKKKSPLPDLSCSGDSVGALAANKPLVLPGVGKSGIDNLQGNRIVMVTKHHDRDPRRLRTSEK